MLFKLKKKYFILTKQKNNKILNINIGKLLKK
jgi:hypothetical protein